jgi:hypothetical protein
MMSDRFILRPALALPQGGDGAVDPTGNRHQHTVRIRPGDRGPA